MSSERGQPPTPPAPHRRLGLLGAIGLLLLVLALLAALATGGLWWIARTDAGTAWLLARVPGVQVVAPRGSLFGDFSAQRVEIALPGATAPPGGNGEGGRITLTGVRWNGLRVRLPSVLPGRLSVHLDTLQALRIDVRTPSAPATEPPKPPASLRLPLQIDVDQLRVGELHAAALGEQPVRNLQARVRLAGDDGATHRVEDLSLSWDRIRAQGEVRIDSEPPFALGAQLALAPTERAADTPLADFEARLTASGRLEQLQLQAALRGRGPAGPNGVPSLDLQARVLPFAAWPLGALDARMQAIDLSALLPDAPATSISGSAHATSDGLSRPASVILALQNARSGRVDEGLVPLRSLNVDVRGRPDTPTLLQLQDIDAQLGTAREAAGRLQGSGLWSPQRASLDARLSGLRPRVLDARAPDMQLSGSARLQAEGLAPGAAGAPADPRIELRTRLAGGLRWNGREQPVTLELDAGGSAAQVELRQAKAQAGASRATLSGQARRQGGAWQLRAKGAVAELNPAVWWPGPADTAWRHGRHSLNATLDLDMSVPADIARRPNAWAMLAALRGRAEVALGDSLLAGTPLAGRFAARSETSGALSASSQLDIAGNRIGLSGQLDSEASGSQDHWEIETRGADLARLAPLMRLLQAPGAVPPALAGLADAQASVDGRWPSVNTRGSLSLKQARLDEAQLAQATLRWQLGTSPQAPLDVQAELSQLVVTRDKQPMRLDSARLAIQGSAAEHRLTLAAASPVKPPPWVDMLQTAPKPGRPQPTGTLAELRAQGGWLFAADAQRGSKSASSPPLPTGWKGVLQRLELRGRGSDAAPWLSMNEVALEAGLNPSAQGPGVLVGAGRAQLPGAGVRWRQVRWQGGSSPLLELQAELEPIAAAPLLARLQPDFGWGGDLVVAGRVNVRSAPSFVAEVELARQRGDLTVTDEAGTLELGLTDLRLALDAQNGVWHFTQALAGKTLGAMAGAVTARTTAQAMWPPADAPIGGVLEARVANLAAWGAWVPPGWRLAGMLHASASIAGRFGAPEYTGQVDGSGLGARNLLQGIDVHDGELAISLQGPTARIDKLQARAGDGSVRVEGNVGFGARPQALLRLVAERLRVLGRVDRRIVASGDATLELNPESTRLDGRFRVDEGLIDFSREEAPALSDDVSVRRADQPAEPAPPPPERPYLRNVAMNVQLDLGDRLRLKGRGIDTQLRGTLRMSAPNGKLAVNGAVRTERGTYAAYGQKLDVERGVIAFSGPTGNPRLDIVAVRPNTDIRVGVAITGTALNPRVRLFSEPELSDTEKLSWLVLGRASEGLGGAETALLQRAAMALLAGEGSGAGGDITRRLGLDEISLRQSNGEVRETIVSLGKQLSQRWYVGYERSLNATAGTWQLIYRVAQRFTLRAQSGLDNSMDVIWTWRW